MNKKRCFIFDMDGTILNTLEDLADSMNHVLKENGFPERTIDEVRRFVGNGLHKFTERAVPAGSSDDEIEKVYTDMISYYKLHCLDKTKPYPGILELMRELNDKGMKLAVVSNKADVAVQELSDRFFPGLLGFSAGESKGYAIKPAPDLVFKAMKYLGATPEETVYVGDSEVDVATAKNAGLDHIIVTWGFRDVPFLREKGALVFVDRPEEILGFADIKME